MFCETLAPLKSPTYTNNSKSKPANSGRAAIIAMVTSIQEKLIAKYFLTSFYLSPTKCRQIL